MSINRYNVIDKLDFKMKNKIEMKSIFKNQFEKCKFKDYAPNVFDSIRKQFGVLKD